MTWKINWENQAAIQGGRGRRRSEEFSCKFLVDKEAFAAQLRRRFPKEHWSTGVSLRRDHEWERESDTALPQLWDSAPYLSRNDPDGESVRGRVCILWCRRHYRRPPIYERNPECHRWGQPMRYGGGARLLDEAWTGSLSPIAVVPFHRVDSKVAADRLNVRPCLRSRLLLLMPVLTPLGLPAGELDKISCRRSGHPCVRTERFSVRSKETFTITWARDASATDPVVTAGSIGFWFLARTTAESVRSK